MQIKVMTKMTIFGERTPQIRKKLDRVYGNLFLDMESLF